MYLLIYLDQSLFSIMNAAEACAVGTEITSESRCLEAREQASSLGLNPQRPLQIGSWNGVPHQCSAQVLNDDAVHFSTNVKTNNSRFMTGEFLMICEKSKSLIPSFEKKYISSFVRIMIII